MALLASATGAPMAGAAMSASPSDGGRRCSGAILDRESPAGRPTASGHPVSEGNDLGGCSRRRDPISPRPRRAQPQPQGPMNTAWHLSCSATALHPDVLLRDCTVTPLGDGDHSAAVAKLADDARPL